MSRRFPATSGRRLGVETRLDRGTRPCLQARHDVVAAKEKERHDEALARLLETFEGGLADVAVAMQRKERSDGERPVGRERRQP